VLGAWAGTRQDLAPVKFRNALMTSLNEHAYNVGSRQRQRPRSGGRGRRPVDFLLTAAVLDIRAFSIDPFFDPADVDFTAQVNLLDPDGRTRYTRHIHVHQDRRLWFNPAFGARDMLDAEMDRVSDFVATDSELVRVLSAPRGAPSATADGAGPIPSDESAPPAAVIPSTEALTPPGAVTTVPLSEIPAAPAEAPLPGETTELPPEEAPPSGATPPFPEPPPSLPEAAPGRAARESPKREASRPRELARGLASPTGSRRLRSSGDPPSSIPDRPRESTRCMPAYPGALAILAARLRALQPRPETRITAKTPGPTGPWRAS
jgi:hypothetical protein